MIMKCPRDASDLEITENHDQFHHCILCRGFLIKSKSLLDYVENNGLESSKLKNVESKALSCPICSIQMKQITSRQVDLDVCQNCGYVWFDEKEFNKILSNDKINSSTWYLNIKAEEGDFGMLSILFNFFFRR
jgi:Zn-finger nucleic acid-binding protein